VGNGSNFFKKKMFQTFSLSHQTGQGALRTYLKWGIQYFFRKISTGGVKNANRNSWHLGLQCPRNINRE